MSPTQAPARGQIPGFQRPPSLTETLPATEPPQVPGSPPPPPSPQSDPAAASEHRKSLAQKLAGIRTGTSSEDGAPAARSTVAPEFMTKEAAQGAAAAMLGVLLMAGALAVRARYRRGRKLRQPTDDEERRIVDPIGRILHRHIPKGLTVDVFDGLAAAAAFGTYVNNGDLTTATPTSAGDPAAGDLSEIGD